MSGRTAKDRAKAAGAATCQHLIASTPWNARNSRDGNGPSTSCGALAKWFINNTTGKERLCGRHAAYWRRRGFIPLPIIKIKQETES